MGIILKQTDNRSRYQEKIAAELQERAKKKTLQTDLPDGVEDSEYIKGTRKTDQKSVINIVAGVLAVVAIAIIMMMVTKK